MSRVPRLAALRFSLNRIYKRITVNKLNSTRETCPSLTHNFSKAHRYFSISEKPKVKNRKIKNAQSKPTIIVNTKTVKAFQE